MFLSVLSYTFDIYVCVEVFVAFKSSSANLFTADEGFVPY